MSLDWEKNTEPTYTHTRKTSRIHTRWPGNGTHSLLACWLSVLDDDWTIVSYLRNTTLFLACNGAPAMVQMSNFIKTLNVFRGSLRNQLHFYGESLVLLYVWFGLLLSKKHLQGERNIFLLFSVHNQALYSLHQIDVTFLWKWEMSGVAQKLETLTLSPDTFGRGPGVLLTLSVWILSPRRRAFALKWLEKQKKIHFGFYSTHQNTFLQSWANLGVDALLLPLLNFVNL